MQMPRCIKNPKHRLIMRSRQRFSSRNLLLKLISSRILSSNSRILSSNSNSNRILSSNSSRTHSSNSSRTMKTIIILNTAGNNTE